MRISENQAHSSLIGSLASIFPVHSWITNDWLLWAQSTPFKVSLLILCANGNLFLRVRKPFEILGQPPDFDDWVAYHLTCNVVVK